MIVTQIGYSYKNSAQGAITMAIENELSKKQIENYVLFSEEGIKSTKYAKQCNPTILSVLTRVLNKLFGRKKEHSFIQTAIALYWLRKIKPDIVHFHVIHHGYYDYERLFDYLKKQETKVVFTMHDMWIMTGGCYHFSDIGCEEYKDGCKNCPGKKNMDCSIDCAEVNYQIKKRFIEEKKVQVVAVSEWVKRTACTGYIPSDHIQTIWNGIDTSIFCPNKRTKSNRAELHIVGVANEWSEDKGILSIYQLAEQLGNDFVFDLIGDCPHFYKKISPQNVNFIGRICDKTELANKYREADVFLHLSKCETFGMVIAEAACCGIPVIAYKSTGIEEVVNRVNGTLVNTDDLNSIQNILMKFKATGIISHGCVSEFISSFSIETMVNEYLNCYQEIWNGEK